MENIKEKTITALIECGVNMSSAGAMYIMDLMSEFEADEKNIYNIGKTRKKVAKKHGVDIRSVTSSIERQLVKIEENNTCMEKYFKNTKERKQSNMLAILYYSIRDGQ